jgi:aminocarboxymuconate-semialdehyde decarboxylase
LHQAGADLGVEVSRDGDRVGVAVRGGTDLGSLRADLLDIDHRLASMDDTGVDVQVLSNWIDLTLYELPPEKGARYARIFNEAMADLVSEHPTRFGGLATVPLQAPELAAMELVYAVRQLGLAGVEIATTVNGDELDRSELDPFWEAAAALRCTVLLHPYNPLAGRGLRRYFLANAVGRPAETTIAIGHIILGGVLERHPGLVICLVHGGGFLPYQLGRLDRAYHAKPELAATRLTRPPSEWARSLYFDTVTHRADALDLLLSQVGSDHLLMGSDYPFEMGDPDPVETVRSIPDLSDEQRLLVLGGNARRLLDASQA